MRKLVLFSAAALMAAAAGFGASAKTKETILYNFTGTADGRVPSYMLLRDGRGNLYGTTISGGTSDHGVVYKVSRRGEQTVLHTFLDGDEGSEPLSNVVMDSMKNLYGTTVDGGNGRADFGDCEGECGTIYRLKPNGQMAILHAFTGLDDGGDPSGGITMAADGSIYGTTGHGGAHQHGVVFKITLSGQYSVLHAFEGGFADGDNPVGNLILDDQGDIYGTTPGGGEWLSGTVFKLKPNGKMTILSSLGGDVGDQPLGGLLRDGDGNLYGTTAFGGNAGFGAVFKLAPNGTATALYAFKGAENGMNPVGTLSWDAIGNIYGTAGGGIVNGDCPRGCGIVYRLTPEGKQVVLHRFGESGDGRSPGIGVTLDGKGALYGVSGNGGASNAGAVYRLKLRD